MHTQQGRVRHVCVVRARYLLGTAPRQLTDHYLCTVWSSGLRRFQDHLHTTRGQADGCRGGVCGERDRHLELGLRYARTPKHTLLDMHTQLTSFHAGVVFSPCAALVLEGGCILPARPFPVYSIPWRVHTVSPYVLKRALQCHSCGTHGIVQLGMVRLHAKLLILGFRCW